MAKDRKEESLRYYEKNKDAINARRRTRRKEDAEFCQRQDERSRKWREKINTDPEAKSEKNRKQREWYKNSEKAQIKAREYRKEYKLPETSKIKKKGWVAQRRADHMAKLVELLGGKCRICGLVDDPIVYDFHHVDPKLKEFALSQRVGTQSWDVVWKEAQKCVLLCAICHRKLTHGRIEQPNWANQVEKKSEGSG